MEAVLKNWSAAGGGNNMKKDTLTNCLWNEHMKYNCFAGNPDISFPVYLTVGASPTKDVCTAFVLKSMFITELRI